MVETRVDFINLIVDQRLEGHPAVKIFASIIGPHDHNGVNGVAVYRRSCFVWKFIK